MQVFRDNPCHLALSIYGLSLALPCSRISGDSQLKIFCSVLNEPLFSNGSTCWLWKRATFNSWGNALVFLIAALNVFVDYYHYGFQVHPQDPLGHHYPHIWLCLPQGSLPRSILFPKKRLTYLSTLSTQILPSGGSLAQWYGWDNFIIYCICP